MEIQEIPDPRFISEGLARVYEEGNVFYNPVQEFNRDISICVLNTYLKKVDEERNEKKSKDPTSPRKVRVLDALSATGLRSFRFAKEVPGISEIIANDFSFEAVKMIEKNIKLNGVEDIVSASKADAMTLMYTSTAPSKRFTIIDLDPYGGPNKFLDGAVQSVEDGGILLVTATDMAVLAGNTPEACIVKYGVVPLKTKACHEMALRILIKTIETQANRYGRYIQPLLSFSVDFYIRVVVRVFTGQFQCKESSTKQSMVYQCTGCNALTLQPLAVRKKNPKNPRSIKFGIPTGPFVSTNCEHCNSKHHMAGPIYSDKIHDEKFVESMIDFVKTDPGRNLGTFDRILGILSVIREELHDIPLYYTIDHLCGLMKLEMIPHIKLRSAILHEGFRVSCSHAMRNSLKTDAPMSLIWDILRFWSKSHPVNEKRMIDNSVIAAILSKEPLKSYDFDTIHPQANPQSKKDCLVRYQENPSAFWGPGTKATLMIDGNKMAKSFLNQNKNKNRRENKRPRLDQNVELEQTEVNVDETN